jgi:hypothetical protein
MLPQLLRAADVARLAALVTAAQQDDYLPAVKSVINAQARINHDSQFEHSGAHRLAIAEISCADTGQAGIHRRLHSLVPQGIEPYVKRNQPVLKLQLLNFPFDHLNVIYR